MVGKSAGHEYMGGTGGYLCILCTHSVRPCYTLSISAPYRVLVCGRYRNSRLICVWFSDLDLSPHRPVLCGAAGPHGRRAQTTVNRGPISGGWVFRHNLHSSLS